MELRLPIRAPWPVAATSQPHLAGIEGLAVERYRWRRGSKSHLPYGQLAECRFGGIWLLVRDPRDAIYSWHQYHRGFAKLEWEVVDPDFEVFLQRPFFCGPDPISAWAMFYDEWLRVAGSSETSQILRFEDLKLHGKSAMSRSLRHWNVYVDEEAMVAALEASTYEAMRVHEDAVISSRTSGSPARMMRSGKVGGWREWMTPELERLFSDPFLWAIASNFGYSAGNASSGKEA
ncbi:sulfotransferase domain-containing protein [Plantactinospora sp. KLBMP9567]|uniref:sulfotransferase domain-containing protein n=1 Tax=Plantactinospora sp. KLBMP9567 TaxID=3085900 RepID=UPI0029824BA7|nr:sulfotransferase domain-containing protein [Plantactinospora sp. KLBMP9567]MDW5326751.1 sulfotransferase domain-containing protein [Plantactinospora sp. KLBMP9567]